MANEQISPFFKSPVCLIKVDRTIGKCLVS